MLIKSIPNWHIHESQATNEASFFNRRSLLIGASAALATPAFAQKISDIPDPTAALYPVKRNANFTLDRPLTDEKIANTYNETFA
jgi:methionine sulfoxide reductase catalytic subunit